ncbi:class E sortase [Streptomyces sp. Act143]|uniref:class E sortase n=1 Tax=Streptomyces sp. Act143 TaxID=2200760 RepID=UPI000D682427|nr:class E sortase [Streptomyces sp. Act143]PWI18165.1 class E sortase [Streptomyces sp. Act143]
MRIPVVRHDTRRRRARRRRAVWAGGELLVTVGVVLLLLVAHQLWWTNREARRGAERKVEALEREWGTGAPADPTGTAPAPEDPGDPPAARTTRQQPTARPAPPRWSQAYAILTIPRLHLRVPVAEGVGRQEVLDKGYAGHYPGTQQPGQAGNFALAGHRNTHGEPFRYLDRLADEDTVQVETRTAVYTYAVDQTLDRTSARDSGVIGSVPRSTGHPSRGYSEPGHYLTLTTCTPEYTSRYRLVVWAKLSSVRPR